MMSEEANYDFENEEEIANCENHEEPLNDIKDTFHLTYYDNLMACILFFL